MSLVCFTIKMHWEPFCNSNTWVIDDRSLKEQLLSKIRNWWNSFECNIFPGPQPISIERKHMQILRNESFWVCAKTDGVRYILACVAHNGNNYCFLINRKKDIFLLNFTMPVELFLGTVLDGELVKTHSGMYDFLVYDCVIYNGISMTQSPHSERIRVASQVCSSIVTQSSPFSLHAKVFYDFKQMESYVDSVVPTLNHNTDGYIFTPETDPIRSGTHNNMFKWKEQSKNTVDFLVERNYNRTLQNPYMYVLKISKGRGCVVVHGACFQNPQQLDLHKNAIVECEFNGQNTWSALLIRTDKSHANNFLTYQKTLLNIKENIQVPEFFQG